MGAGYETFEERKRGPLHGVIQNLKGGPRVSEGSLEGGRYDKKSQGRISMKVDRRGGMASAPRKEILRGLKSVMNQ